jgi:hypothetical protein
MEPAVHMQILIHGQFTVQINVLGHQAILIFRFKGLFFNIMAVEHGFASAQAGEPGQYPDRIRDKLL